VLNSAPAQLDRFGTGHRKFSYLLGIQKTGDIFDQSSESAR